MVKAQAARKPHDKVMRLLKELRERPNEDGIRRIANVVEDARRANVDYYGLGRAIRKILGRELTEKESVLLRRLP